MLHEVLLALSGHPSPIFEDAKSLPYITAPERSLLQSLGHLANLHRALRTHLAKVSAQHPSIVCRAVASAIASFHLSRFQTAILKVEKSILSDDPRTVGAYKVVPLAKVVGDFRGWDRLLEWYWSIACLMLSPEYQGQFQQPSSAVGTGPKVIDKLRKDLLTGYSDVEDAAVKLCDVAENAWIKQLSAFLMSGTQTNWDFFIQSKNDSEVERLEINSHFCPEFLDAESAQTILQLGVTVRYLTNARARISRRALSAQQFPATLDDLRHVRPLADLRAPIRSQALKQILRRMRASLSIRLTQGVLPSKEFIATLGQMHRIFFLQRADFTDVLVEAADTHLRARHSQMQQRASQGRSQGLVGIMMREGELTKILSQTWVGISSTLSRAQSVDRDIEWSRENIELRLVQPKGVEPDDEDEQVSFNHPGITDQFNEFLLSTPTALRLKLRPPFDLVLTSNDLDKYSAIHNYLIAIRRAHLHLTQLWRESQLRKGAAWSPSPKSSYKSRMFSSRKLRERFTTRSKVMRSTWATCNMAMSILLELGEFLISDVAAKSWQAFVNWIEGIDESKPRMQDGTRPTANKKEGKTRLGPNAADLDAVQVPNIQSTDEDEMPSAQNDPETIASAHRKYLVALTKTLMLDRTEYLKTLKTMLLRIDHFVGLIHRLRSVQSKLDLAEEGVDDGFSDKYLQEERDVHAELQTARGRVHSSLNQLIDALRTIDMEEVSNVDSFPVEPITGYEPWTNSSLEGLLIRFDTKANENTSTVPTG